MVSSSAAFGGGEILQFKRRYPHPLEKQVNVFLRIAKIWGNSSRRLHLCYITAFILSNREKKAGKMIFSCPLKLKLRYINDIKEASKLLIVSR